MIEGLLRAARNFEPQRFLPLVLGADSIGWIRREQAGRLRVWPGLFEISDREIRLQPAEVSVLSTSLAQVARALADEGAICGWRDETYAVRAKEGGAPLFHLERAAMRFFGLTSSAAHLNGYAIENKNLNIWIARRAATKGIDPGMLDTLVGGGIPSGEDAWRTLLRECAEEAGISVALAEKSKPAKTLRVCREVPDGLHSEILYAYDLELPADFTPRISDGEVSEFLNLEPAPLVERIARGELTVEAGLVAADFLQRRGLISP